MKAQRAGGQNVDNGCRAIGAPGVKIFAPGLPREAQDVFKMQDEIAAAVVAALLRNTLWPTSP